MRNRLCLLTLVLSLASIACNSSSRGSRIEGEGPVTASEHVVTTFDRISLSGGMKLNVRVGEAEHVVIHAEDNLHEHIRSEVRDGELKIWIEGSLTTSRGLSAEVDVQNLRAINISGDCTMDVSGLEGEVFALDISGAAKGHFAGAVQRLKIENSGSSDLDLFDLEAEDVSIDISGSGKVKTTANERLDIAVSGRGLVTYRGKPEVSLDQSGAAKVVADS